MAFLMLCIDLNDEVRRHQNGRSLYDGISWHGMRRMTEIIFIIFFAFIVFDTVLFIKKSVKRYFTMVFLHYQYLVLLL